MPRLLWASLLAVLAACPGPVATGPDSTFVVGPGGGTFEHLGARVIVPPSAVTAETTLTIGVVDTGIPEVAGRARISLGYRLGPSTVSLQLPIQLEVPYVEQWLPAKAIEPSTYDMRRYDGAGPALALGSPETLVDRKVVSAHSDRLGLFWVTSPLTPDVSKVQLVPSEAFLRVGEKQQFSAEVTDAAGKVLDVSVSWSILPARVARVDATGLVEALAPGTATLTVIAGDQFVRAFVYVIGDAVGPFTFAHENPFPTGNDLLGGAVAGEQALFVGKNGTVLTRSATGQWVRQFSAPGVELRAIAAPSGGAAAAVGVSVGNCSPATGCGNVGVLIEMSSSGNQSPSFQTFTRIEPRALWFDGTHGMAVGYGDDVLVRRDGRWMAEYSPSFETLLHVVGDGAGGFVTVGSLGSLYIFDPLTQTWDSLFDTQLSVLLISAVITRADGSEAWAVGGNKLWHFQGAGWSAINLPATPSFDALTAVGVVDGRVVVGAQKAGRGLLFLYTPETAVFATSIALRGPQIARAIFGSENEGYAIGDYGAVWQYSNGIFTELSRGFYGDVMDVYATPELTVAAVNECADADCSVRVGRVMRRSAVGAWEALGPQQQFGGLLFSIAVRSPAEVYVGGRGAVWRYDGAIWTWIPVASGAKVNDLAVCGPNVWGVGDNGLILTGQSSLTQVTPLVTRNLWAVSCRDQSEVWIAGDQTLFAVRGNTPVFANDPEVLHAFYRGLWSPGFNEVYAFGDARYGVYWNGRNLMVYDRPGGILPDVVTDLWGSSVDNLYAVGSTVTPVASGYALRFNGAQWSLVDAGSHRPVNAVHGSSAVDIYLVTEGGGILRGVAP